MLSTAVNAAGRCYNWGYHCKIGTYHCLSGLLQSSISRKDTTPSMNSAVSWISTNEDHRYFLQMPAEDRQCLDTVPVIFRQRHRNVRPMGAFSNSVPMTKRPGLPRWMLDPYDLPRSEVSLCFLLYFAGSGEHFIRWFRSFNGSKCRKVRALR